MKMTILLSTLIAVALLGCSEQAADDVSSSTDADTTVKTMEEYRSEAEQQITDDNAEAELDKIEQDLQGE